MWLRTPAALLELLGVGFSAAGGVLAVVLGKLLLAAVLAAIAFGLYARLWRRRRRAKAQ